MSSGKVKCTCGWSWNKSDSSKKDMYICHECGRDNSNNMKNGGWLDSYADGGTMQEHQENYNDASVSLPEGFVGMGNNTKGRNYSPAWGGQFQMGGEVYPVNYVPKAQDGDIIPSDLPDPVNGIIYDPEGERTYYDDRLDRIVLTPSSNFSPRQSVINHEKFHKYQFDNLGSNYEITHEGAVPLFKKPSMVSTDEEYYKFHNRKGREAQQDIENVKSNYPEFTFVPNQVLFDKIIDREQYSNPFTLEGEAQAYENSLKKNQMGGSIPGAVGFSYARVGAPSKGPRRNQTDVTDASAQNGKEMKYYQEGLDFKPKTISKNGGWLDSYDVAQDGKKVKFDPKKFEKFMKDQKANTSWQNKSSIKEAQDEERRRMYDTKEYQDWVKANKIAKDKAIVKDRKDRISKSIAARDKSFTEDNWRQKLADETQATGDKFRLFPDDPDSFIDDYINPGVFIGNMASKLGSAPLRAEQENSYMPYVTSVAEPVAMGAVGELLSGIMPKIPVKEIVNKTKKGLAKGALTTIEAINDAAFKLGTKYRETYPVLKKSIEAANAGNAWTREWYSHPEIQNRYNQWIAPANNFVTPKAALTESNMLSFIPDVPGINLNKGYANRMSGTVARNNLEKLLTEGKFTNPTTGGFGTGNRGMVGRFSHGYNDALVDITHPSFNRLFGKGYDVGNTFVHENTHAITKGDFGFLPEYLQRFKEPFARTAEEISKKQLTKHQKYLVKPTEVHARINEIRKTFDLSPETVVDDNMVNHIIKEGLKGRTSVEKDFFKLIKDKAKFKELMNTAPAGAIGVGLGAAALNKQKDGGVIKDDMGQWAHPGEITEIGSNQITMQGVPYPVLGISNTGDVQMMYPDGEYEYDGESVTEFPMAKNGLRQEQKGLVNLDNLTNFTNYNTKQPGGWLDKFALGGVVPAATTPDESYDIKEGDTLFEIARDKNVPLNTLASANKLPNPDLIKTGNKLVIPKQYKKELSFNEIPTTDNKKIVIDNFSPHYDYIVEGDKTYYKVKSGNTWADISDNKQARANLLKFLDKNDYWKGYGSGEKAKFDKVYHQPVIVPGSKVPKTTPSVMRNTETGNKPAIVKRPIAKVVKEEPGFFDEISDFVSSGYKSLQNKWEDAKKQTDLVKSVVEESVKLGVNKAIHTTEDAYHTLVNGIDRKFKTHTGEDDDVKVETKISKTPKTVKEWYGNKSGAEITQVIDAPNTNGRVYKQQVLPTSNIKFGVRNRGEYKDINTDGLEVTTFNEFSKSPLPDNTTVLAVDPKGNLHTGTYKDFKGQKDYLFSKTFKNNIIDFPEVKGKGQYVSGAKSGNPKYQQPKIKVLDDNGKVVDGSLNILVKDDSKKDYYGQVQGGRVLFVNPDTKQQYLVSGSINHIKQKFKELKGNSKYLEAYTLDNGTYSRGLSYKDKKLTKDRLKSYDLENTGGGNGLYIIDYKQPVSKYEEDYIDNMPNVRTENDTSYKKGHALKNEIKNIVLHHTAYTGPNAEKEVNKQYMTKGNNSSHIVIQQNGKRTIYASPEQVTFHAGESEWNKRKDVNDFSIGVEFQGDTNRKPLTQAQIESFVEYYAPIAKKYNLSLKDIITHQMIAPGRKPDINEKQYARILKYMRDKNFK